MKRRELIAAFGGAAALWPLVARAQQQPRKVPRIVYFAPGRNEHLVQSFLQGLADLGYAEGRNITIEFGFAEGHREKLDQLAAETVKAAPDVVVGVGAAAGVSLQHATRSIPIVLAPAGDPVQAGLVASLAAPGGNITGVSLYAAELNQKRLQLLKEVIPSVRHVAVLINRSNQGSMEYWRETKDAGDRLGLETQLIAAKGIATLGEDFAEIKRNGLNALIVTPDAQFDAGREQVVGLAAKYELPAIYEHSAFANAGGLLSYGPNIGRMSYRAAAYVDKILKGARPADLPIEQPTNFELIVNLKAAKALGLPVPQSILARADEVIE